MKRRKPGLRGRHSRAQKQIGDARAHFLRGFVGERDRKDRFGGHALGNQIGHTEGDGAGLARSCSGKDQYRPFYGFRSKTLFGIEFVEKIQHLPAVAEMRCLVMVADGTSARKLTEVFSSICEGMSESERLGRSVSALSAQVYLEVHERMVLLERPHIGDVEMRGIE